MNTHPYPRYQLFCKRGHYRHPNNITGIKSCKACSKLRNPLKRIENRIFYKKSNVWKRYGFNNHLKSEYGITLEDYAWLLHKQNFACAICLEINSLHLDHNHKTNKVRGILCYKCNHLLGQVECNQQELPKLLKYLRDNA